MKRFEVGKRYEMFSPCDMSCTWYYEVIARTAKTMTLKPIESDGSGKVKKVRILEDTYNDEEWARPLGRYSMCPVLRACREF